MKKYQFIDTKGNINYTIGIVEAKSKIQAIKKINSNVYFKGNNPYAYIFYKILTPIIIK
jgi:hypothetical protein